MHLPALIAALALPATIAAQCDYQEVPTTWPGVYDLFGTVVAIDGGRAVVGDPAHQENGFDSGGAFVYRLDDDVWVLEETLFPHDARMFQRFGGSVGIDEGRIVVGATRDSEFLPNAGAAYVFELQGDVWVETQKLVAPDIASEHHFGTSIDVSGNALVVGDAYWNDPDGTRPRVGTVYAFQTAGPGLPWTLDERFTPAGALEDDLFGAELDLSGDTVIVMSEITGAAYVFTREPSGWAEQAELSGGAPAGGAGTDVALDGDRAIFSTNEEVRDVHVFERSGTTWSEVAVLHEDAPTPAYGCAIDIHGDWAIVGDYANMDTAYVYHRKNGAWYRHSATNQAEPVGSFGTAIGIADQKIIVGTASRRVYFTCVRDELLDSGPDVLSVSAGAEQILSLDAGAAFGGATYLVLGSLSGSSPGVVIGGHLVPLVIDTYTLFSLTHPNQPPLVDTLGVLDLDGRADARFEASVLSAGLVGTELDHAFLLLDAFDVILSSNARPTTLVD